MHSVNVSNSTVAVKEQKDALCADTRAIAAANVLSAHEIVIEKNGTMSPETPNGGADSDFHPSVRESWHQDELNKSDAAEQDRKNDHQLNGFHSETRESVKCVSFRNGTVEENESIGAEEESPLFSPPQSVEEHQLRTTTTSDSPEEDDGKGTSTDNVEDLQTIVHDMAVMKVENEEKSAEERQEASQQELLPSATAEAMETYENLRANAYLGAATGKSIAGEESMPCDCRYDPEVDDPSAACGDDNFCINRMMFMECTEKDCSCGRFCRNRRFQLRQYARVDVIKTEKKGYGLRALTDLPTNAFVMEYIGEVITNSEFIRRTKKYEAEGLTHYYFMTLRNDEIIDATKKGCLARFINHSCNPNCVTQKWVVGKAMRIGIFTRRPVKAGEELTFDYKFERYGAVAQKCYCGEPNCKGFIGGVLEEDGGDEDGSGPRISVTDDEDDTDTPETLKKTRKKPGRKRVPRPLKDPDEVQTFVKKMLDSVGKVHLVNKLLQSLELTTADTPVGKDVLKKFIRLHGLKILKIWLGEWKNNDDVVSKVLQVLSQLPLANRNGLEDCKMFDVIQKFVTHENEKIQTQAKGLLEAWSELKTVYRIPKRVNPQPKTHKADDSDANDNKTQSSTNSPELNPRKRPRFESTREFFDPDDDYYAYLPVNVDPYELNWKLQYLSTAIPTGPRAHFASSADPYYYHHYDYAAGAAHSAPKRRFRNEEGDYSYHYHTRTYHLNYTRGPPSGPRNPYERHYGYYSSAHRSQSEQNEVPKLPANWYWAMSEDGKVYYYNRLTGKSQWEVPEEKASSIEGVSQSQLDGLVEKAIMDAQQKKKQRETSQQQKESNDSTKRQQSSSRPSSSKSTTPSSRSDSGERGLTEVELKHQVGKIVTKHLTTKHKSLWKDDKALFKELARKLTHHVVDREMNSSRKITEINDAIKTKIVKFIDAHGADFVHKINRQSAKSSRTTSSSSSNEPSNKPSSSRSSETKREG